MRPSMLLAFVLAFLVHPAKAQEISLYYDIRPPFLAIHAGDVSGRAVRTVSSVLSRAGISYHWHQLPQRRQIDYINDNLRQACMIGWYSAPHGHADVHGTLPFLEEGNLVVLARVDSRRVAGHEDLTSLLNDRVLTALVDSGYRYGGPIDGHFAALAIERRVIAGVNNLSRAKMIALRRADYMLVPEDEARYLVHAMRKNGYELTYFKMPAAYENGAFLPSRRLVCSRSVSAEIIHRVNQAIITDRYVGGVSLGTSECFKQSVRPTARLHEMANCG